MCVVSHGYGGGRDGGGRWYVCGAKPRGLVACRAMPEDCEVKTPITPPSRCATPDRVNPELVGLSRTPREGFG